MSSVYLCVFCAYICICVVYAFVCVHLCVCVCVPSEYYLLVVGDGQRLLVAKVLSQIWSSFVESRTPFDGII